MAGLTNDNTVEYQLNNGLKVFLVQDPSASLVSVRTYVRAGSITEDPYLGTGISHYLEHILAGGSTTKRSEDDYKTLISKLGGAFNAYTTIDHTSYFINTVPSDTTTAIEMLYEWMFFSSFDKREVGREKEVIIKEIEKNNANIYRKFYSLSQHNFYKYHPIRLPVIGYLDKFKTVSRDDLINYHKLHYTPSNMMLVIGGNFDVKTIKAFVDKTFGSIPHLSHPPTTTLFAEPRPFAPRINEEFGNTSSTMYSMRFATTDLFDDQLYALDLIDFILGNGDDSLLYKRIVEEKKLAYGIHTTSYTPPMTTGYFEISAEIDFENREALQKEVLLILDELKTGSLPPDRIQRAKKQKLAEDIFSIDTIEDKVSRVGQSYLYGHSTDFFDTYVDSFKKVNRDDIKATAEQFFNPTHMVTTLLRPEKEAKALAKKETPTNKTLAPQEPVQHVLKNGVRVIFYKDDSLPRVHSKLLVMGGVRAETKENNGIGNLIATTLGKQSKHYPKKVIQDAVEGNGAALYGTLGNNTLYSTLLCLEEDFKTLLPIQIDTFINPVFAQKDVNEERRQILKGIEKRQDDWFSFGRYNFKKNFYGKHHYGLPISGEAKSVKSVKPLQMTYHHESFMVPSQLVVTVYGDFDESQTLKILKKQLGTLKSPPSTRAFDPSLRSDPVAHTDTHEKQIAITQDVSAIFIGFDGSRITDTDTQLKLDLLDAVLSGMSYPGGRLHNLLREKGMVYVVHGTGFSGLEKGHIMFYALSSPDKIQEVKTLILKQIEDVKQRLVTQDEFEQAMAQVNFYYKDRHSSLDTLSIVTATDEIYGLGFDHYLSIDKQLKKLTRDDIKSVANTFLIHPQIYIFQK